MKSKTILLLAGLTVWVLAPMALVLSVPNLLGSSESTPEAQTAPFVASEGTNSTPVDVALLWSAPEPVLAPNWTGTVDQIQVTTGDTVSHGTPLLRIDGISRIAWHTPGAFWRPLGLGDSGDDVVMLQEALNSSSYSAEVDGTFDRNTLAAVRKLAKDLGIPNASTIGLFSPEWVVRLPIPAARIAKVNVAIGQHAPGAGSEVFELAPELAAGYVLNGGSVPTEAELTGDLLLAENTVQLEQNSEVTTFSGLVLATNLADSSVAADSLVALRSEVQPGQPVVLAQHILKGTQTAYPVPPSAIRVDQSGASCVFLQDSPAQTTSPTAVLVDILGSQYGVTRVSPHSEPPASSVYLINAGEGSCT